MKTDSSTSVSAETFTPANRAVRNAASVAPGQTALYDTQAAALVFCCGIVFKVSSLPGLVAERMLSGTLWLYLFMLTVDALSLAAVLSFARCGGARVLAERKDIPFRVFSAAASLWLILKGVIYFGYTVVFLMVDLFEAVPPYVVIIVLALPVLYLGVKGLRSVARCAELFAPVLFLLVLFNLALLETDLDFGRNLPLAAMPSEDFFARGLTFGMWLGDLIPLAFAEVKRRRKFPALPVGAGVSYALVAVIAMLAVAMYGAALPYAYNMLIRIAGFNKLSIEIGRMEWAAIFVVIVMAVLALSLHFWGAREGCRLATGSSLPASLLFSAGIIVARLSPLFRGHHRHPACHPRIARRHRLLDHRVRLCRVRGLRRPLPLRRAPRPARKTPARRSPAYAPRDPGRVPAVRPDRPCGRTPRRQGDRR